MSAGCIAVVDVVTHGSNIAALLGMHPGNQDVASAREHRGCGRPGYRFQPQLPSVTPTSLLA